MLTLGEEGGRKIVRKINDNVCYFRENYAMLIAYRKEINHAKLNLCGFHLRKRALEYMQSYLVAWLRADIVEF